MKLLGHWNCYLFRSLTWLRRLQLEIRSVVLPSAMKMLGNWNCYPSRSLTCLPRLQLETGTS